MYQQYKPRFFQESAPSFEFDKFLSASARSARQFFPSIAIPSEQHRGYDGDAWYALHDVYQFIGKVF